MPGTSSAVPHVPPEVPARAVPAAAARAPAAATPGALSNAEHRTAVAAVATIARWFIDQPFFR